MAGTADSTAPIALAGRVVSELYDALREGGIGLRTVPVLMKKVLDDGLWRERKVRGGKVVTHTRFADFITAPPLDGLGESPDQIKRLLHDHPETLAAFEREIVGKHGGDHKSKADNVSLADHGNSKAYTLRRLEKDHPELFQRVCQGELSANAAAIEAGFRKTQGIVYRLQRLWEKATLAQRNEFLNWTDEVKD